MESYQKNFSHHVKNELAPYGKVQDCDDELVIYVIRDGKLSLYYPKAFVALIASS